MDSNVKQYLITALFSSLDHEDNPLDDNYSVEDIDSASVEQAEQDWKLFLDKSGSLLDGLDLSSVAHDFWLTRHGHGAGFWDGDYEEEVGEKLTDISKTFSELNIEVGENGKLYFT